MSSLRVVSRIGGLKLTPILCRLGNPRIYRKLCHQRLHIFTSQTSSNKSSTASRSWSKKMSVHQNIISKKVISENIQAKDFVQHHSSFPSMLIDIGIENSVTFLRRSVTQWNSFADGLLSLDLSFRQWRVMRNAKNESLLPYKSHFPPNIIKT